MTLGIRERLKASPAMLAVLLCTVHGPVGIVDQIVEIVGVTVVDSKANAAADVELPAGGLQRLIGHPLFKLRIDVSKKGVIKCRNVMDIQAKLIACNAHGDHRVSDRKGLQPLGKPNQILIPHTMAIGVVDLLEGINVNESKEPQCIGFACDDRLHLRSVLIPAYQGGERILDQTVVQLQVEGFQFLIRPLQVPLCVDQLVVEPLDLLKMAVDDLGVLQGVSCMHGGNLLDHAHQQGLVLLLKLGGKFFQIIQGEHKDVLVQAEDEETEFQLLFDHHYMGTEHLVLLQQGLGERLLEDRLVGFIKEFEEAGLVRDGQ
ncbi:hypothetical protein SDC9_110709 [bioreactor metagenome]|uniref:Uncharacterized protein n=1 Tax=bioreactor metagenome TaxID=1076179 RepID=A0A645BEE9_9ZZZZ